MAATQVGYPTIGTEAEAARAARRGPARDMGEPQSLETGDIVDVSFPTGGLVAEAGGTDRIIRTPGTTKTYGYMTIEDGGSIQREPLTRWVRTPPGALMSWDADVDRLSTRVTGPGESETVSVKGPLVLMKSERPVAESADGSTQVSVGDESLWSDGRALSFDNHSVDFSMVRQGDSPYRGWVPTVARFTIAAGDARGTVTPTHHQGQHSTTSYTRPARILDDGRIQMALGENSRMMGTAAIPLNWIVAC